MKIRLSGCAEGEIRLAGGASSTEGRVEICLNDAWGTVCGRNWSTTEADVACRQLGLEGISKFKVGGLNHKFCMKVGGGGAI